MAACARHEVVYLSKEEAKPDINLENYFEIDRKYSKPGFRRYDGSYNWHCPCVASYVSGPCGYFFRNFLENMNLLMANDDSFKEQSNRKLFKTLHSQLMGCMKSHPNYYKSLIDDFSIPMDKLQ